MHFPSTTILAALFGTSALHIAHAAPFKARDACPVVASGFLAATVNDVAKAFTLNANDNVHYIGDGVNKLAVEFLHCEDPNIPSSEFGYAGIIYVPSKDLCVGVSNQPDETGPYFTELQPCNQRNYAQQFHSNDLTSYVWLGETDEEGYVLQAGCGVLYYQAKDASGAPFVAGDGGIEIVCSSDETHVPTATERAFLITANAL